MKEDSVVYPVQNVYIDSYLKIFIQSISKLMLQKGIKINLNRFDLFHGHLFYNTELDLSGVLFHAEEYPDVKGEPLGFCNKNSTLGKHLDFKTHFIFFGFFTVETSLSLKKFLLVRFE